MNQIITLILFLYAWFYILNPAKAQAILSQQKDSLQNYVQQKQQLGERDWSYFLALKELSKQTMFQQEKQTLEYLNEAANIAATSKDSIEMAAIAHLQGVCYRHWGYTYAAAEFFQYSYILAEKIGRRVFSGYNLINIGNLYYDLEKWQEAKIYFNRGLYSFESISDSNGIAVAYNNIGLAALELEEYDSALYFFKKGRNIRVASKDPILIAHSLQYLSSTYLRIKEYKKGLDLAQKGLTLYQQPNKNSPPHYDLDGLPISLHFYAAQALRGLQQIDSAIAHLNEAVALGRKRPNISSFFLSSFGELASIYQEQGLPQQAIETLEEGIDFAQSLHYSNQQEELLLQMSALLAKNGQHEQALSYLQAHYHLIGKKSMGASNQMLNFHALFENYEQKNALYKNELLLQKERSEKKQRENSNRFYLTVIVLMLLGFIIVLQLYRRNYKINKALSSKNTAIENQKNIIESNAKELEALYETKDLLFSIIAHDLRTPFNTLTNFSNLMQNYIKNNQWDELKASFQVLEESSQKAYWTFENLLGWIQSQTGKLNTDLKATDIRPLLEDVIGLLSSMLLVKKINIKLELEAYWLEADANMLQTVLRNILTNAVKFSKENSLISIRSTIVEQQVQIELNDQGIGISNHALKDLFNPQKLKSSSQSISGLGLIICKNFIQAMQGKIWVESQPNKGTSFYIQLPLAKTLAQQQEQEANAIQDIRPEQFHFSKNQIICSKTISPYLQELKTLSVYEVSEVKAIVQQIQQIPNLEKEVKDWLSFLNQALYITDASMYEDLLDLIQEDEPHAP